MTAPDWRSRLDDIAREHDLRPAAAERLGRLLVALHDDPSAPTTVRDPALAVDVHLADSLAALRLPELRAARHLADVGSGAGFPGLPLAISLPGARVDLVESTGRKCVFLERAVDLCEAANATVVCERVEAWPERALDVVCVRAVAPLSVLVEYAAPLLRLGGVLVAWKGRRDAGEEAAAAAAGVIVGLEEARVEAVRPFPAARHRSLHVYAKVRETPPGFPRRPGAARKRPVGR